MYMSKRHTHTWLTCTGLPCIYATKSTEARSAPVPLVTTGTLAGMAAIESIRRMTSGAEASTYTELLRALHGVPLATLLSEKSLCALRAEVERSHTGPAVRWRRRGRGENG